MNCPKCQKPIPEGLVQHRCASVKPSEVKFIGFMVLSGEGAFPEVFRGRDKYYVKILMQRQIPDNWNDLEDNAVIYNWPDGDMVAFYTRNGWVEAE